MGSKQRRTHAPAPVAPAPPKGAPWLLIALGIAAAAGVGIFIVSSADRAPAPTEAAQAAAVSPTTPGTAPASNPAPAEMPSAGATFTSEDLDDLPMPPLPYMGQTAGPPDVMQQAYVFAARNPDVLGYVPCYCGCGQTDAHQSNVDCFVGSRAPNGAVESWDTHGMT